MRSTPNTLPACQELTYRPLATLNQNNRLEYRRRKKIVVQREKEESPDSIECV